MRNALLVLVFILISTGSIAQEVSVADNPRDFKNTIFIEAFGHGLFGSLNYERQLFSKPGLSLRAGVGFYAEDAFYLTLPLSIQYLISLKKENYIEVGIGYTWADAGADELFGDKVVVNKDNIQNYIFSAGYRKNFGNNWMWKVNFSPIITNNYDVTIPWVGFSIGKSF